MGNHEYRTNYNQAFLSSRRLLPRALLVNKFYFNEAGFSYLVEHGQNMDIRKPWVIRLWGNTDLLLYRITGIDWQQLARMITKYRAKALKMETEYAKRYQGKYDAVILGHTHEPSDYRIGNLRVIDCGDWIHHKTSVIIDNDAAILIRGVCLWNP